MTDPTLVTPEMIALVREAIRNPGKYLDFVDDHDEWKARAAIVAMGVGEMREALERIALGEVPGDPNEAQSMYMNARKIAADALRTLIKQKDGRLTMDAMREAFKEFFDEQQGANVEWDGWGEGRVLVDAVFDLDALLERLIRVTPAKD